MSSQADRLIRWLDLQPHPEGGYYRETFRDTNSGRPHSTAIYYLLKEGQCSRLHRVDAAEIWHFYAGAPLELTIGKRAYILGPAIDQAQAPQIVVPPHTWQAAKSLGEYSLVGCTVAPGFMFEHFEIAPAGLVP